MNFDLSYIFDISLELLLLKNFFFGFFNKEYFSSFTILKLFFSFEYLILLESKQSSKFLFVTILLISCLIELLKLLSLKVLFVLKQFKSISISSSLFLSSSSPSPSLLFLLYSLL